MNLAILKYGPLMAKENGIIDKIEIYKPPENSKQFVAYAYLNESITKNWNHHHEVYGRAHGTGTAFSKTVAIYKAISEALERWAFFDQKLRSPTPDHILLDGTSNGFAAFPGFNHSGAKVRSEYEAVERSALVLFSRGQLKIDHVKIDKKQLVLHFDLSTILNSTPLNFRSIWFTLVCDFDLVNKFYFYGFAARKNREESLEHALFESERNQTMISNFLEKYKLTSNDLLDLAINKNHFDFYYTERRLLFYATDEGKSHFDKFVTSAKSLDLETAPEVKALISIPIVGPWSKYTSVWRTVCSPIADPNKTEHFKDLFIF